MRAGIILAALAATSFALPQMKKRDMVVVYETETDIVWVTALVTVTASPVEAFAAATPTSTASVVVDPASGRKHHDVNAWSWPWSTTYDVVSSATHTTRGPWRITTSTAPAAETTTVVVPPVQPTTTSEAVTTTNVVPVPPPVTSSTTTPEARPTTSTTPEAQPTTTTTAQAQAPTVVSQAAKPTTYEQLVVAHHNLHRRNHSAPDIAWDAGLANAANTIASSCKYGHNTDVDKSVIGGYGQNIAAGVGSDNITLVVSDLFYNGEVNWYDGLYGQAQPDMTHFDHWGHFSQIVWRDSVKVGCATVHCDVLQGVASNVPPYFTVCNYQAPGNVQGQYGAEIGKSLGYPTAHWDYYN